MPGCNGLRDVLIASTEIPRKRGGRRGLTLKRTDCFSTSVEVRTAKVTTRSTNQLRVIKQQTPMMDLRLGVEETELQTVL